MTRQLASIALIEPKSDINHKEISLSEDKSWHSFVGNRSGKLKVYNENGRIPAVWNLTSEEGGHNAIAFMPAHAEILKHHWIEIEILAWKDVDIQVAEQAVAIMETSVWKPDRDKWYDSLREIPLW